MKTNERLGFFAAGVALTLLLMPLFESARSNKARSSCQTNLKYIGLAFNQYLRDYDERLPLKSNWRSAIQPYVGGIAPTTLQCPLQNFAYVYNSHLSGLGDSQVARRAEIALVYEGATTSHFDTGQSWFPFAHSNGSNVVYANGHVRWITESPRFFSPEMAHTPAFLERKRNKQEADMKAWWSQYPKEKRPLAYR
jgi:hypothetical protein